MMEYRILPYHNYDRRANDPKEEPRAAEQPPAPVKEVILRAFMHCDGCARKFRRKIRDLDGVEEVTTDLNSGTVVVKGEKLNPAKILETAQNNHSRRVDIISLLPPLPAEQPRPPPDIRQEVIRTVFEGDFHCLSCAEDCKRKISRLRGVHDAELDSADTLLTVKGVFSPEEVAEYVNRDPSLRSRLKIARVCLEEDASREDRRSAEMERERKRWEWECGGAPAAAATTATRDAEQLRRIDLDACTTYLRDQPPHAFNDENPHACTVM